MGAELGATTLDLPLRRRDGRVPRRDRARALADLAERVPRSTCAPDPEVEPNPERVLRRVIEIDLSTLEPHVVGPHTPDRAARSRSSRPRRRGTATRLEIKVALIGTCTNSSYEDIGAPPTSPAGAQGGLKARDAVPGHARLRADLRDDRARRQLGDARGVGGTVLANACGPCIGQWKRDVGKDETNTIVTSFNRNFPGRNDGNPGRWRSSQPRDRDRAGASPAASTSTPLHGDAARRRTARQFSFTPPEGAELPGEGFARDEDGYVAPAADGAAVAGRGRAGQRAAAAARAVPALGRQGLRPTCRCCSRPRASARPTTSRRPAVAALPRPPRQHQRQHVHRRASTPSPARPGKGIERRSPARPAMPFPKIARDYKAQGLALGRRRRRELRRGLEPRARRDVAALPRRAGGDRARASRASTRPTSRSRASCR